MWTASFSMGKSSKGGFYAKAQGEGSGGKAVPGRTDCATLTYGCPRRSANSAIVLR